MATTGIILIITCLFSCGINEYFILIDFVKVYNSSCNLNNSYTYNNRNKRILFNKCSKNISEFDVRIVYFSFSCVELIALFGIFLFSIIRDRIIFGLDKPKHKLNNNITQGNPNDPRQNEFVIPSPDNVIISQKKFSFNEQQISPHLNLINSLNISPQIKNDENLGQIFDYNIDIKSEDIQKKVNNNSVDTLPKIKNSFSSQQCTNTQQSQMNSSQSQISFPKSNFISNKQLFYKIGKLNFRQTVSSERKF